MKIQKEFRLEKVASTDETRSAILNVKIEINEQCLPDAAPTFTVALNPRLLLALAEAIGCEKGDGVKLEFSDAGSPIRVTKRTPDYRDGNGARGVLMPMSLKS